jgi:copper chaperone CopZ
MADTLELTVTGMTCGGCENAVVRSVTRLEGVANARAAHKDNHVSVTFDPAKVSPADIKARIAELGYTVAG